MVLALVAVLPAGCTAGGSAPPAQTGSTPAAAAAQQCPAEVAPRPLPSWARAGFTPPDQPIPYVLGDGGDIVAILWAEHAPLVVPPVSGRNKILWVSRTGDSGGAPLQIQATLTGSGQTVTRTVPGGPGPSGIDLPAAGCWSVDLTWGEHRDHLQLRYQPADAL